MMLRVQGPLHRLWPKAPSLAVGVPAPLVRAHGRSHVGGALHGGWAATDGARPLTRVASIKAQRQKAAAAHILGLTAL
jgi:hypothetical protein